MAVMVGRENGGLTYSLLVPTYADVDMRPVSSWLRSRFPPKPLRDDA